MFGIKSTLKMISNRRIFRFDRIVFISFDSLLSKFQFLVGVNFIAPIVLCSFSSIRGYFASLNLSHVIKIMLVSFVIADPNKRLSTKDARSLLLFHLQLFQFKLGLIHRVGQIVVFTISQDMFLFWSFLSLSLFIL